MTASGPLASLLAALQQPGERPPAATAWEKIAATHLAADETVLFALEGNGFTWWVHCCWSPTTESCTCAAVR